MRLECTHEEGRAVRVDVHIDKDDVSITRTPMGVRIELADCHNLGVPGAPALPRRTLHVALPEGTWPETMRGHDQEHVALTHEAALVVPVQALAPGVPRKHDKHDDETDCNCKCCRPKPQGGPWEDPGDRVDPFPTPPVVPPDAALYEAEARERAAA